MRATSRTSAFRQRAESRMLDTFDVKVSSGGFVYDEDAGADIEVFVLLFTTAGRVKVATVFRSVRDTDAGGRTVATSEREFHIPVNSPAVPVGAVAVCTSAHATSDPTLLGAKLRLAGPAPGSQTTARRLSVTEVMT